MACIAQMVNVLQSVILTEGPKMVKTPTYHVFHMYKYHQGAQLVDSFLEGVGKIGVKETEMVPEVQESVSVDEDGVMTVTLNNLCTDAEKEMEMVLEEKTCEKVEAPVFCGGMRAYNSFEEPERVNEEGFTDFRERRGGFVSVSRPAAFCFLNWLICLADPGERRKSNGKIDERKQVSLAVYTRRAVPGVYPDGLARSVHFAVSRDGKTYEPWNSGYGILFAEGTITEQNTIRPKCVKDPHLSRRKDGSFAITARRVEEDGSEDEESRERCFCG